MRKIGVLVLGTYRSGTSALTGVLHGLGFNSNYTPKQNDFQFSPTGSYNDNYFETKLLDVNWNEFFALKSQSAKWCSKHHILLQNNLALEFHNNFPEDTEKWLIVTDRNFENAVKSFNEKSTGNYATAIQNHIDVCNDLYSKWTGQKTKINFFDLIQNTENTIKDLCVLLNVEYVPQAIEIVKKEISKFGD